MSEFDPTQIDFSNPKAMQEAYSKLDWNDPKDVQTLLNFLRAGSNKQRPHPDLDLIFRTPFEYNELFIKYIISIT